MTFLPSCARRWLTAQCANLSALKTHKKVLMQQLFPSPEEVEA